MEGLTLFHLAPVFRLRLGVVTASTLGFTLGPSPPSVAKPMDSKLSILKKNEAILRVSVENDSHRGL